VAAVNDSAQGIRATAAARQVAPVPAGTLAVAKTQLVFGAALGKSVLGLTDDEYTSVVASLNDNANWTNFDGDHQCGLINGVATCQYVARAKRLNTYPNALETVFFDRKDPTNPTYALYVALVGADSKSNAGRVKQLCTTSWQASGSSETGYTVRSYFTDTRQGAVYSK
jgi:hypothetical protein